MATPFDSVGFQCVELSARYMWALYGEYVDNVPVGEDFVAYAHAQYGISVGYAGTNSVPAVGDVVSISGGRTSYGVGHTAIVAAVHVNPQGNGSIRLLQQNASAHGWGTIRVSGWTESYGGTSTVSWLELSHVRRPIHLGPNVMYHVLTIGKRTDVTGINRGGVVSGVRTFVIAHSRILRPFTYFKKRVSIVYSPAKVGTLAQTAAINNSHRMAVSANAGKRPSMAFAIMPHGSWRELRRPEKHVVASAALGINERGDIAGWAQRGTGLKAKTRAVVWVRVHRHFRVRHLPLQRGYRSARAYASDGPGDVVGSETDRHGRFHPVLWLPDGRARRLPRDKHGHRGPGTATSLWMTRERHSATRVLTIVGSVSVKGFVESTAWRLRVTRRHVRLLRITHLGSVSQARSSIATSVNQKHWAVGDSITPQNHGSPEAFLRRPSKGLVPLELLTLGPAHWNIIHAAGINVYGQIAAEGYWSRGKKRGPIEGLLLDPVPIHG
jgi:hypothetical protein